jgi:hypothetical protein
VGKRGVDVTYVPVVYIENLNMKKKFSVEFYLMDLPT